jgi:hypothetical protein
MKRKISRILSLQEYAKKRRKERVGYLESDECAFCEFFRKESQVCLGGGGIVRLNLISQCPITRKYLKQTS